MENTDQKKLYLDIFHTVKELVNNSKTTKILQGYLWISFLIQIISSLQILKATAKKVLLRNMPQKPAFLYFSSLLN